MGVTGHYFPESGILVIDKDKDLGPDTCHGCRQVVETYIQWKGKLLCEPCAEKEGWL